MNDIIITDGLPEAWTLANTDKLKLDDANLINLAVGELALLGASQGTTLRAQTLELKKMVSSIDYVNDVLSDLSSGWNGETASLGFPDGSIGFSTYGYYFNNELGSDTGIQSQMLSATATMGQLGVQYGGYDAYSYTLLSGLGSGSITSRKFLIRPPYTGSISTSSDGPISLSSVTLNPSFSSLPLLEGQIYDLKPPDQIPGIPSPVTRYVYISPGSGQPPALYKSTFNIGGFNVGPLNGIAIPSSATELNNWQLQAGNSSNPEGLSSAQISINNTSVLTSTTELSPRTNTPPSTSDAILLGIVDPSSVTYDMAQYKATGVNGTVVSYQPYPPANVSIIDSSVLIPANVGKVFQRGSDAPVIIYADNFGRVNSATVSETTKYISNVSVDQLVKWRSQYAEKIILITQRSSNQLVFVNNLAQKYQYAFDAATNVLKAFTAMLTNAANNV